MATATKAPAKKAAPTKVTVEDESKGRGRPRDLVEEARILKALLPKVTVEGEGVRARVTGIGEAASGITLDSGKSLDSTRAKMILLRHLAEKAGESVKASPAIVVRLREEKHLSWAQIDAMTGTPRSTTLALYDEAKGETGAWRKVHLVSRDGGEGIRPRSERAPSSKKASDGSRAKLDAEPVLTGEETRDEIIKLLTGKNITWNGSGSMAEKSFKAKVVSVSKVGKGKEGRVVQFSDGDKSRTVTLTAIVKVGGR